MQDPEINIHPDLVHVLKNPDEGGNMLIAEYILNPFDNEHYKTKAPRYNVDVEIPGYFGGCWGMHMLHLPGDFESYERLERAEEAHHRTSVLPGPARLPVPLRIAPLVRLLAQGD